MSKENAAVCGTAACGVCFLLSWITIGAILVADRPEHISDLADLRDEMEGRQPEYYNVVPVVENGTYSCTTLARPVVSTVPLMTECPIDDRVWLTNAGICYCSWVPCAILFVLILSLCRDSNSSCDGEAGLIFLALGIFVVGWGLVGGMLTAYVLPRSPNCRAEVEMGSFVAISHAAIVMLVACVFAAAKDDEASVGAMVGCIVITALGCVATAVAMSVVALGAVAGAASNTCLACGASCRVVPSSAVAWSTLEELNGRVAGCHLVHCWEATEASLGGFYPLLTSTSAPPALPALPGAPPPLPPAAPGGEAGSGGSGGEVEAGSGAVEFEDVTSRVVLWGAMLGACLLAMCVAFVLWRRELPLREKPRAILASVKARAHETPVVIASWVSLEGARSSGSAEGHSSGVPTVVGIEVRATVAEGSSPTNRLTGGPTNRLSPGGGAVRSDKV